MGNASVVLASAPSGNVFDFLAGVSAAMVSLEGAIVEIAATNIPVLLMGEIGTGKETFARRIHQLSSRHSGPFTRISCTSTAVESFPAELALNGNADSRNEQAGTVLFDEIGELDEACQRKLVCILPDDESNPRVGCLSARVISTTSHSLDEGVRNGTFRRDLYYRVNGVALQLPALRERKEDIPLLVDLFLAKHSIQLRKAKRMVSPRTMEAFVDYAWPGNIRELENVIKKIVVLNDESLAISELSRYSSQPRAAVPSANKCSLKAAARAASREAERGLILEALARTRWNRKRAAQQLQISYKSLLYKLKEIGVEESPPKTEQSRRRK